jgi:hypothetical protein
MASYPNLRAHYHKGTLKLKTPLKLPEGTEVRVSVALVTPRPRRRSARRLYSYPNRPLASQSLPRLAGKVSLGGDALGDSEALYD